jgi:hypothetical protein
MPAYKFPKGSFNHMKLGSPESLAADTVAERVHAYLAPDTAASFPQVPVKGAPIKKGKRK